MKGKPVAYSSVGRFRPEFNKSKVTQFMNVKCVVKWRLLLSDTDLSTSGKHD